jgi:hypothetical protein
MNLMGSGELGMGDVDWGVAGLGICCDSAVGLGVLVACSLQVQLVKTRDAWHP